MIVSHRHRFIFICNGKTGTTSIEQGFLPLDECGEMNGGCPGLWDGKHMPAAVAQSLLPRRIWDGYFKFAFVRNPYDWCVSQYVHNFRSRLNLRKMLRHPILAVGWLRSHWETRERRRKVQLDAADVRFLFHYLRRYRALPMAEGLFQSSYVNDADGVPILDFVGRFESLSADIRRVQQEIGIQFELPHLNATKRPHHSRFLTPEAASMVRRLWRVDFENFGYDDGSALADQVALHSAEFEAA